MPRITKSLVDAAEPKDDIYYVWDEELKGFYLRVHSTGSKSYGIRDRIRGKQVQITIGRHGPMTTAEARKKAMKLLAESLNGAELKPARGAPTVAELCARYLNEHVAHRNKASTARAAKRLVATHVLPALGKIKIEEVTRHDVLRLHHELRHATYEANRLVAVLSKMFNLAELWGLRPDNTNPCRHVQRYREHRRERFFTDEEMKRLGEALTAMENDFAIMRGVATAVRLLALTGCRMSEILGLKWAQVDLNAGSFRLDDAKAGARTVTLNAAALTLLARIMHAFSQKSSVVFGLSTFGRSFATPAAAAGRGDLRSWG
jgi:integrase